ncbi:hypothetical protein SSYRP_v1c05450 [Spiroplasma syrphidicola EA-1]|uniref:Transmembrane protein n=1 Tax=Spiroplasma syrphidicola EA-1 TaxID=1276229 RepID=R4UJ41_9MOLU|nr:hypothetical protein [Spiroplasma syrphidicola]AGM26135.1 hypothetical protein SSYRP_v1c05450 [Spiroplasma syrphidicola EA-1]
MNFKKINNLSITFLIAIFSLIFICTLKLNLTFIESLIKVLILLFVIIIFLSQINKKNYRKIIILLSILTIIAVISMTWFIYTYIYFYFLYNVFSLIIYLLQASNLFFFGIFIALCIAFSIVSYYYLKNDILLQYLFNNLISKYSEDNFEDFFIQLIEYHQTLITAQHHLYEPRVLEFNFDQKELLIITKVARVCPW